MFLMNDKNGLGLMVDEIELVTTFRKIRNGFWEEDKSRLIIGVFADKLVVKFINEFEDYKLDFKQELPPNLDKIGELISAISNEGGGVIFFGITNDRKVRGIKNIEQESERIFRISRDGCNPQPELQMIKIINSNSKKILAVLIPKPIDSLVSFKDIFYKRIGDSKEKMPKSEALKRQIKLLSTLNHYELLWEKSSNLLPIDILGPGRGLEKYGFNDYYLERNFDMDFSEYIHNSDNNILVIGGPLSGKSRLVYENLKKSKTPFDIIIPKYVNFSLDDINIPDYPKVDGHRILVLDDLDRYFTFEYFELLFQKFLEKSNIRIIATCQTGKKYIDVKNRILSKLNIDLDTIFTLIRIDLLAEKDAKKIAKELNKKWDQIDFDGNIGTILVPFAEMKRRYGEDCSDKARYVLKSIKIAYLAEIISEKSNYRLEWISSICSIFFDLSLEKYELITLIEELGPDRLEFIQIVHQNEFFIEESYLEKIIDKEKEMLTIEEYNELINYFYSNPEVLVLIGNNLLTFGQKWSSIYGYEVHQDVFNKCIECFERLLELSPGSNYAYGVLGSAYSYIDEYDKSIFYYETAIDYNPEICQFWGNLGIIYRTVKNYYKAIFCFKKVLELIPDDSIAYYQLAITYNDLNDYNKALEFFDKSLEFDSKSFAANVMKGILLKELGEFDKAIPLLKISIELRSDEPYPLYYLAEIYSIKNDLKNALFYLKEAIKINPYCKKDAKENSAFDNIRDSNAFQNLID